MNGACNSIFFCPGEGSKGQISFNFNYKVNFKDFYTKLMCVLTNERYKTYQTGFLFCCLGHAPGVGLWGVGRAKVVNFFFQTWSCGISNRRGCKQNRMQVTF